MADGGVGEAFVTIRPKLEAALFGAAAAAIAGALSDATRAAAQEEANVAKLSQALENAGLAYDLVGEAVERKITAQQRSFGFADSAQRDSLSNLIVVTRDVNEAFRLQALAMDLARARGLDLVTASNILVRVYSGNTTMLKRYGIIVKEGATATEALGAIQAQVAGQAKTFAATSAGAMEIARAAFSDIQEALGGMVGGLAPLIGMLPGLSIGFSTLAGVLAAATKVINLKTIAWRGLNLVMSLNPVGLLIKGLVILGTVLVIAYEKSEAFRQVVNGLFEAVLRLLGPLGNLLGGALQGVKELLGLAASDADKAALAMTNFGAAGVAAMDDLNSTLRSGFSVAKTAEDLAATIFKDLKIDPESEHGREILNGLRDTIGRSKEEMDKILFGRELAAKDTAIWKLLVGPADETVKALEKELEQVGVTTDKHIADLQKKVREARKFSERDKAQEELDEARLRKAQQDRERAAIEAKLKEARAERDRLAAVSAHVRANVDAALSVKEQSDKQVEHVTRIKDAWLRATEETLEYTRVVSDIDAMIERINRNPTFISPTPSRTPPASVAGPAALGAWLSQFFGGKPTQSVVINAPVTVNTGNVRDAHDVARATADAVTNALEEDMRRLGAVIAR